MNAAQATARAFTLPSARVLAAARERAAHALDMWAAGWLHASLAADALSARAFDARRPDEADGWLAGSADSAFVWTDATSAGVMSHWLLGTDGAPAGIAAQAAGDALRDLLAAWLEAGGGARALQRAPLPAACRAPGIAVVELVLRHAGQALRAVCCHPAGHPRPPSAHRASAPLAPLAAALQGQAVALSLQLGEVEMDLQTLYGLAPGDVMRFEAPLDQPLELRVGDERVGPGVRAYLGALGGHRAIEIVASGAGQ